MTPHLDQGEPPTSPRVEQSPSVDDREADLTAREALQQGREEKVQKIIAAADERDDEADARDTVADERDQIASRAAFLSSENTYDVTLKARRSAAADRWDSKTDRTASAQDRSELTEDDPDDRTR